MNCSIELNGMRFYAYHGVYDSEQHIGQWFLVDLRLVWSASSDDLASDRLDKTLNYEIAREIIARQMEQKSRLLEHVAWRIQQALSQSFPKITSGHIRISKQHPPFDSYLSDVTVQLDF